MAPATQPAYISASFCRFSGKSPIKTTSLILKCPPGFNTRNISLNTFFLLGTRFSTQLLTITSAIPAPTGICSISPCLNSTLLKPRASAFILARSIMAGVKSIPITFPVSPVSCRAIKQSFPAPLPKSITTSPFLMRANSVGSPQPSPKSAAA